MTEPVKKGRKPRSNMTPVAEVDEVALNEAAETARQVVLTQHDQEKAEVLGLGKLIGRMEAAEFFGDIANSVLIKTYEDVKKSKTWRNLRNPKSGDASPYFESLDDFCEVALGKSYRRLREMSGNMRLLGEQLYEQAEKLGLRQVDYNAIKALPAPDQELIRQAVEDAQSKDEVLTVLQELAAKHAKERQELEAELSETRAELESKIELLDKKGRVIDELEAARNRIQKMPPDKALAELQREAQSLFNDALGLIRGTLRHALLKLDEHEGDNTTFMAGLAAQLKNDITALQHEFSLPDIEAGQLADLAWLNLTPEEIKAQTQAEYGEKLAALKAAKSGEASKGKE